jgi:integrase
LAATNLNATAAQEIEFAERRALKEAGRPTQKIVVKRFVDAAKDFLDWAKANYQEHPSSYDRIKGSFASAIPYFDKTPVSLIDKGRIDNFKTWRVNDHGIRGITLRHDLHALSKFFGFSIGQHWTKTNPIREVDIPSDADAVRMHVLKPQEEKEYFKRAAQYPDLHDVGRLMINLGVRPEEATVLAKEDVDLKRGTIHIQRSKSNASDRILDLTAEARKIIARRMGGKSKWIFPSERIPGDCIGRINSAHDRLVAQAAQEGIVINWVPYDLRHTFATRIAQLGVDLVTLAALLGHSSIRMVQKYVHPTAEHKKAAMAWYSSSMRAGVKTPPRKPRSR